MITVPQKLLNSPQVEVIHHDAACTILSKQLHEPLLNRQSYVSRHAISVVLSGQQRIISESGEVVVVNSGEIGFVKKGIYTVTDLLADQEGFRSLHVYVEEDLWEQAIRLLPPSVMHPEGAAPFFSLKAPSTLDYFRESLTHFPNDLVPGEAWFRVKVLELFALIQTSDMGSQMSAFMRQFQVQTPRNLLQFMETHFDKTLNIEDYAYLTGRSVSTFRREFKSKFGITPRKWIIRRRMEKAQEFMKDSQLSIADIAFQVGYENTSHFIQVYKREFGHTPGQKPSLLQARV